MGKFSGYLSQLHASSVRAGVNLRSFDIGRVAAYSRTIPQIQIRGVPARLHRQLEARAESAGLTLSHYLMREIRKLAQQLTPEQMRERLKARARRRA